MGCTEIRPGQLAASQPTCSAISCGPVAQFRPISGTSSALITAAAAAMSGPTSSVPVVSTVTCTKIGVSVPAARPSNLGAVDRGLDLQRVLAGLDQDGVDAAGDQAAALFGQGLFQRVIGDIAEAGQLGAGANAANDPAVAAVGETVSGLARQFASDLVDLERTLGQIELAQRHRRRAEGVGFDHVGAGCEVAAMDLPHQIGARQHQHVGAVLAAPVVLLHIQRQRLHPAAHAAVAQQDAVAQGIEQMRSGHSDSLQRESARPIEAEGGNEARFEEAGFDGAAFGGGTGTAADRVAGQIRTASPPGMVSGLV